MSDNIFRFKRRLNVNLEILKELQFKKGTPAKLFPKRIETWSLALAAIPAKNLFDGVYDIFLERTKEILGGSERPTLEQLLTLPDYGKERRCGVYLIIIRDKYGAIFLYVGSATAPSRGIYTRVYHQHLSPTYRERERRKKPTGHPLYTIMDAEGSTIWVKILCVDSNTDWDDGAIDCMRIHCMVAETVCIGMMGCYRDMEKQPRKYEYWWSATHWHTETSMHGLNFTPPILQVIQLRSLFTAKIDINFLCELWRESALAELSRADKVAYARRKAAQCKWNRWYRTESSKSGLSMEDIQKLKEQKHAQIDAAAPLVSLKGLGVWPSSVNYGIADVTQDLWSEQEQLLQKLHAIVMRRRDQKRRNRFDDDPEDWVEMGEPVVGEMEEKVLWLRAFELMGAGEEE